jgi:photosystem II stability/assembly factor-like uncharacterized protein/PKD repeat protein
MEGAGRIDRIMFHPADSNVMYIASPGGGLWRTRDYAEHWVPLTDSLPVTGVADMAISHLNPELIYIATGDAFTNWSCPTGIYRSENEGMDWFPTSMSYSSSGSPRLIYRLHLNPQNDHSLFAGTSGGLFHSFNGGEDFDLLLNGFVRDMEWPYGDSSVFLVTVQETDSNIRIHRSTDGGLTFQSCFNQEGATCSRIEIASASGVVYAICVDLQGNLSSVNRSTDGGLAWVKKTGASPNICGWTCQGTDGYGAGTEILAAAVSPWNVNEVYVGSNFLWKTTDGGEHWKAISGWCGGSVPYVRPYHRALTFGPDKKIYTGSGGGLFRSENGGIIWDNISHDLNIMPVTGISVSGDPTVLVAGTLENGTLKLFGDQWQFIQDGDGMTPLVYDSSLFLIQTREAITHKLRILKTQDGGKTFTNITPKSGTGERMSPVVKNPLQGSLLSIAYGPFFQSSDMGATWTLTGSDVPDTITCLEQSRLNPDIFYSASASKIYRSANGGKSWDMMLDAGDDNPDRGVISALAVSKTDPNSLWIAFSGKQSSDKVLHSDDGGLNWTDISEGLLPESIHSLAFDESSESLLAGTESGVYLKTLFKPWVKYGSRLPKTRITSLAILPGKRQLFAGSLGRGVWQISLSHPDTVLVPGFSASSLFACGGSKITFRDESTGEIDSRIWDFGDGAEPLTGTGEGPHEVTWSSPGNKTITLVLNDTLIWMKKELIHVIDSIDIELIPHEICSTDSVMIMATGADQYTWMPEQGQMWIDSLGSARLFPGGIMKYIVHGKTGTCESVDTVVVKTLPDEPDRAFLLVEGNNGPYTNECATVSPNDPSVPTGSEVDGCNSQDGWCKRRSMNNTIWFSLVAPESGMVSIDAPGDFNNQIALFSRNPDDGSMDFIAANDDYHGESGNYAAALTGVSGLVPGETYWLMVDGGGTGETGEFYLVIQDKAITNIGELAMRLTVFPNPASSGIYIRGLTTSALYSVICPDGRVLQTGVLNAEPAQEPQLVETGNLPAGQYLLKLSSSDFTLHKIILITR